jgi:hypothetical protein
MGARPHDDSNAEANDRSRFGQRDSVPAVPSWEPLLDHHIEELLALFDDHLARWCG